MCKPMHPLYGALLVPHVPVRVTRGALVSRRCTHIMRLLAAERGSTTGLLLTFQCLYKPSI